MSTNRYHFGRIKSPPDPRDKIYKVSPLMIRELPDRVDNSPTFPILDQGRIGACSAHAASGGMQYRRQKAGQNPPFAPAIMFIYYNTRARMGTTDLDSGADLRSVVKVLLKEGVCPEEMWTYDDTPSDIDGKFPKGSKPATRPPSECYEKALPHRVTMYKRLKPHVDVIRACLADGHVIIIGMNVYRNWVGGKTLSTTIPLPPKKGDPIGGHAMLITGYDDIEQTFKLRNSWGEEVGDKGHFYLPYDYIQEEEGDFEAWVIYGIES